MFISNINERKLWPFGYILGALGVLYFGVRSGRLADDLACFGYLFLTVTNPITIM